MCLKNCGFLTCFCSLFIQKANYFFFWDFLKRVVVRSSSADSLLPARMTGTVLVAPADLLRRVLSVFGVCLLVRLGLIRVTAAGIQRQLAAV